MIEKTKNAQTSQNNQLSMINYQLSILHRSRGLKTDRLDSVGGLNQPCREAVGPKKLKLTSTPFDRASHKDRITIPDTYRPYKPFSKEIFPFFNTENPYE
jgi:hypothetical protein